MGDAFFRALVRHLADVFGAEVGFVSELLDAEGRRARVIASWRHGVELPENYEYELAGTPCELLRDGDDVVVLSAGACERYPRDAFVTVHGLDAYFAVALRGSDGRRIGHLGVQASHPVQPTPRQVDDLQLFAARAAAELERRRHQQALRERELEVVASRARVVQAADDERRRIGRDLHDGAQQRLVALGHLLTLARRRAGDLPEDAVRLLDQAGEQVRLASGELRELARGLHPAGLSERGLRPALEALAAAAPLDVRLGSLPDRRLPDPVELTLYYVVAESLTNAVKYA
ncbi:MAG TPA: histidine kinase, partial [Solirubrobacteraceae bacterium]|nr:histidine kinase [Solirubrobacteraceae bacterium]